MNIVPKPESVEYCDHPLCKGLEPGKPAPLMAIAGDEWPNQPRRDRRCTVCGRDYPCKPPAKRDKLYAGIL